MIFLSHVTTAAQSLIKQMEGTRLCEGTRNTVRQPSFSPCHDTHQLDHTDVEKAHPCPPEAPWKLRGAFRGDILRGRGIRASSMIKIFWQRSATEWSSILRLPAKLTSCCSSFSPISFAPPESPGLSLFGVELLESSSSFCPPMLEATLDDLRTMLFGDLERPEARELLGATMCPVLRTTIQNMLLECKPSVTGKKDLLVDCAKGPKLLRSSCHEHIDYSH